MICLIVPGNPCFAFINFSKVGVPMKSISTTVALLVTGLLFSISSYSSDFEAFKSDQSDGFNAFKGGAENSPKPNPPAVPNSSSDRGSSTNSSKGVNRGLASKDPIDHMGQGNTPAAEDQVLDAQMKSME
jgi:hypothetical protein